MLSSPGVPDLQPLVFLSPVAPFPAAPAPVVLSPVAHVPAVPTSAAPTYGQTHHTSVSGIYV